MAFPAPLPTANKWYQNGIGQATSKGDRALMPRKAVVKHECDCLTIMKEGLQLSAVEGKTGNIFILVKLPFHHQLEDIEVTVADHIQRVLKPNFGAAWDEVGDEYEKEETFTLSTIKTLEGKAGSDPSRLPSISLPARGKV